MDAKTRYRQRRKLQAAIARVITLLDDHAKAGIPPDKTTGDLAAELLSWLTGYCARVEVILRTEDGISSDLLRYGYIEEAKRKATLARYIHLAKQGKAPLRFQRLWDQARDDEKLLEQLAQCDAITDVITEAQSLVDRRSDEQREIDERLSDPPEPDEADQQDE
jgi:hypothetical protein